MKEVARVWKDGVHLFTEVRDYEEDLIVPKIIVVWDKEKDNGKKAPSLDEAIALFDSLAQDDSIN